jgi:hypothetical protein
MKIVPNGLSLDSDPSIRSLGFCQRRHNGRRIVRFHPRCKPVWACVLGLATQLAAPGRAQAQEPMVTPATPNAYLMPPNRPHHLWHFLAPNDGIPRTYSYYYSPWLNQPNHFPVVGPDGKTYWRSTVRGLPMGMQWLAP